MLDNFRQYLIDQGLATATEVHANVCDGSDACIVLWEYGGYKSPIGVTSSISAVQIKVLDTDMSAARTKINAIYDNLVDGKAFKLINNTKANIFANTPPFYSGQDEQTRYSYIFNVNIVTERN